MDQSRLHRSAILLVTILLVLNTQGQAFEKGNIYLDLGLGLAGYQTTATFTFDFLGGPVTLSEEDGSGSFVVPIQIEYGIGDRVGIGAELAFSDYFIDQDDTTETTERVRSVDFSFLVHYHLFESDNNDLMLGLLIGGSRLNWQFKDDNEMTGNGGKFSVYLKDRLELGEHIGLLFQIGYVGYTYNEISTSDNNAILEQIDWELRGWYGGTGFSVRF